MGNQSPLLCRCPAGNLGFATESGDHGVAAGCPRRERPRGGRAAEQRDERAALHSITSSARASKVGGMAIPMALAVLRLMISSNLVGCAIGRSPGFSPFNTRPV